MQAAREREESMKADINKEKYIHELEKVDREGIADLLYYLEHKTDLFTAPASGKYHLSVPGGLVQHSLNVLEALRALLRNNGDGTWSFCVAGKETARLTDENIIVMALLHDVCKVNFYKTSKRNRKNDRGQWESYDYYEIDDTSPLGHGEKSVIMLQYFIRLEKEELYAIRWHMGLPEGNEKYTFDQAVQKHPEIWALHSADMMAAQFMENFTGNKPEYEYEEAEERVLPQSTLGELNGDLLRAYSSRFSAEQKNEDSALQPVLIAKEEKPECEEPSMNLWDIQLTE